MISDQLWSSWFGRDPSVIGKSYFVSDSMKQVIGIMPPNAIRLSCMVLTAPQDAASEAMAEGDAGPTDQRVATAADAAAETGEPAEEDGVRIQDH